ncbi:transcriptional regulator [bacterium]|nr:MAG: transcriptional regulator [bacterium]
MLYSIKIDTEEGNMKKVKYHNADGCPIKATVDVLGGRWKPTLIYHLFSGTKRFNEIRRLMPDVTQRMVTLQLRELEEDGIVLRTVYAQVPPKVEYSLTPFGRTLEPVVQQMQAWGETYIATLPRTAVDETEASSWLCHRAP